VSPHRDRSPSPEPPRPFVFPDFEIHELACGVRLFVAPRTATPLVDLQFLFPAGGCFDPAPLPGLASFTAGLLDEGTGRHSASELAAAVEDLGGYLISGAGWNHAYASVGMLGRDLERGADVLCEVSTEPSFPEEEVERLRRRRLAELKQRSDDPASLAADHFAARLYGEGPYGYPLVGREDSVETFNAEECRGFYRTHFATAGSLGIAVGDLDPSTLGELIGHRLSQLPTPIGPTPPLLKPPPLEGIEVLVVDRPRAAQTELRIGHPGPPQPHPDRIPLKVLNSILGGKFTSRINLNLREVHGYTYGAHSQFVERLGPGPFVVSTAVGNEVVGAATAEILAELRRIRDEPVSITELDDAKNYLLGVFPYSLQTVQGLSGRLQEIAIFDLPADYFNTYPERLAAVSLEDVRQVAGRHLRTSALAVVAVGPAEQIAGQLAGLGEPQIVLPS